MTSVVAALCALPMIFVVPPVKEITDHDLRVLHRAMTRGCVERFPNSPCVARFEVRDEQNYRVTCTGAAGTYQPTVP